MNTNDLNTALYEKMAAEQDKFRDWLKRQPPEEILHHTYEYTVREDIVMAMEELELTDAQAQALLESPSPLADVYRYVTEGTFDAYLWQTVENKQKFISQIMTSKSPVRSCDDVDETALSFAEIKALCAGDPRIKERMDLDVEVSRLKLMKADHQSKQYRLEDQLLKYFPEEIEKHKGFIKGFESDLEVLAAHPHPEDGFAGMEIRGDLLTDKENAGAALLDACKEVKTSDPVQIGNYRGVFHVRGIFRLETGVYAPAERTDDPPGNPWYRPSRKSYPYRQCPRPDAPASGGGKGPAG